LLPVERAALILLLAASPAWGFDANGVALGAREAEVLKAFPAARCQAMDWKTDAADRRCDDAPVRFGGAEARISFYLKKDAVQAFDLRFEARDFDRVASHLKSRYGQPDAERVETFQRGSEERQVRKVRWKQGGDQAVLSAQVGRRRAELSVWRGKFDSEVYRIR
jgi:hypothetical protein